MVAGQTVRYVFKGIGYNTPQEAWNAALASQPVLKSVLDTCVVKGANFFEKASASKVGQAFDKS